jgi:hypothetical protein
MSFKGLAVATEAPERWSRDGNTQWHRSAVQLCACCHLISADTALPINR